MQASTDGKGAACQTTPCPATKILPGYSFKSLCPHKSWKKWSVMTIEATTWCFARLVRDFEKPGAVRRKAQTEKVENTAESACLLWHLTLDLQAQFPISKEAVEKHILEPWADGSHGWDLELHEILAEKREKMAVTDSKMFRTWWTSATARLRYQLPTRSCWSASWTMTSGLWFASSWITTSNASESTSASCATTAFTSTTASWIGTGHAVRSRSNGCNSGCSKDAESLPMTLRNMVP